MKYFILFSLVFFPLQIFASDFSAKCQGFKGVEFDAQLGTTKPFTLNEKTTYEFTYSSENGGKLDYVVDGVGISAPKKSERWHNVQILQQSDMHVTGIYYINQDYMLFTLYPKIEMLHIAWVEHPNRKYKNGASFLIGVNCDFKDSAGT